MVIRAPVVLDRAEPAVLVVAVKETGKMVHLIPAVAAVDLSIVTTLVLDLVDPA